jgi:hypothetical protein
MIQIDGPRRRVYIKFVSTERMMSILQDIQGQQEYKHDNGEISIVTVELASMGVRRVRMANLPPEVQDSVLRDTMQNMATYRILRNNNGKCNIDIQSQMGFGFWAHVPPHMLIAGHRVLISYDGQPFTSYNCNEQGHQYI